MTFVSHDAQVAGLPLTGVQLTLTDRTAETSVFLHGSGDHIVIRYGNDGYPAVLPLGSFAWERAVRRALIGSVFCENHR